MWKSKLMDVFRTLNGTEKRGINKFVSSPFYNKQQGVKDLWAYMVKNSGEGNSAFDREKVFQAIYPEVPFVDSQMRHTMSELLYCIEEYLALMEYRRNPVLRGINLAAVYRKKKLPKHHQQAVQQAERQAKKGIINPRTYYVNFLLEYEKYIFLQTQKRTDANNLQLLGNALDKAVILNKLKQSCMFLAHERVYKVAYDYSFLPEILQFLENSKYLEDEMIGAYYYCFRALSEESGEYFQAYKNMLLQFPENISANEVRDLLQLGINFCIKQLNQGINNYIAEAFNLYRLGLDRELLYNEGFITRFAYKNIVALGLNMEEYEWTEQFILNYKEHLQPQYRKSNFNFNRARWFYSQKKYQEAFHHLQAVDESDFLLSFGAKVMLLKMYYELNELNALESLLESFRVQVNRKKVLSYHKLHFSKTIQFTKRLMSLMPEEKEKIAALKKDILEAEVLGEREWLLEQLAKIGG